jgi:phosphoribosylanthranilate isomerase
MTAGLIKVCGVRTIESALAASRAGSDFLGFVFVPTSPRYVSPELAADIVLEVKQACYEDGLSTPYCVGLFVDAGEKLLAEAAPFLSHFQFHGHEDAERIDDMRAEFGVEIIKAIGVNSVADIERTKDLAAAADMLLLDAVAPKAADRPGGHGVPFDWSILAQYKFETPFLLAGGLTAGNVGAAVSAGRSASGFAGVDVSSGVESSPGTKDIEKIRDFIAAARAALQSGEQ